MIGEKSLKEIDIAVLSDIHSNHIALEACVKYIEERNINNLIFLGDYVSNCAYPEKTMQIIYKLSQEKNCLCIRGNREELLLNHAEGADDGWTIPSTSSGAVLYTYNLLNEKDLDFFRGLKCSDMLDIQGYPRIAFCHGSMENTTGVMDEIKAERHFCEYQTSIILCGHTHHAGCYQYPCGKVINVGSVGTPINETGNAEFVVMHGREQRWKEEFVAVPFDRMKVIQELDESGLVEQSKMFGRMIKDLLLTKKDRWSELLMCAEQICKNEIGSTIDMMEDKYLEKAAEQLGIL